jgi:hypothetical protein
LLLNDFFEVDGVGHEWSENCPHEL